MNFFRNLDVKLQITILICCTFLIGVLYFSYTSDYKTCVRGLEKSYKENNEYRFREREYALTYCNITAPRG